MGSTPLAIVHVFFSRLIFHILRINHVLLIRSYKAPFKTIAIAIINYGNIVHKLWYWDGRRILFLFPIQVWRNFKRALKCSKTGGLMSLNGKRVSLLLYMRRIACQNHLFLLRLFVHMYRSERSFQRGRLEKENRKHIA